MVNINWLHLALFGVIWRYLASFGINLLLNCNLPILIFMYLASFCVQKYLFGDNFLQNWTLLIWIFYLFGIIWHPKIPIWRQFFIWIEYYLFEFISFCTHLASMFTKLNTTHLNFYLFSLIWHHLASIFTISSTTHLNF